MLIIKYDWEKVVLNSYMVLLYINVSKFIVKPLMLDINIVSNFLLWYMNININVSPVCRLCASPLPPPSPSPLFLACETSVQRSGSTRARAQMLKNGSRICILGLWPWESYLVSLCLGSLICPMEVSLIMVPA